MLLLAANLADPLTQHVEDVLALGQLALQRDQAHHVAGQLGILLAAVGTQLLDQRAVAVANGQVVLLNTSSGWLGLVTRMLERLSQGPPRRSCRHGPPSAQIGGLADAGKGHGSVLEFVAHIFTALFCSFTGRCHDPAWKLPIMYRCLVLFCLCPLPSGRGSGEVVTPHPQPFSREGEGVQRTLVSAPALRPDG